MDNSLKLILLRMGGAGKSSPDAPMDRRTVFDQETSTTASGCGERTPLHSRGLGRRQPTETAVFEHLGRSRGGTTTTPPALLQSRAIFIVCADESRRQGGDEERRGRATRSPSRTLGTRTSIETYPLWKARSSLGNIPGLDRPPVLVVRPNPTATTDPAHRQITRTFDLEVSAESGANLDQLEDWLVAQIPIVLVMSGPFQTGNGRENGIGPVIYQLLKKPGNKGQAKSAKPPCRFPIPACRSRGRRIFKFARKHLTEANITKNPRLFFEPFTGTSFCFTRNTCPESDSRQRWAIDRITPLPTRRAPGTFGKN
ncbi:MAG: hypothetical protein H7A53_05780 [Akkermansiaceae bacterium]|nr:hypothetical protein [Akkermansiaceae bacterium]